jgi:uncharacterized cupin superfamily protein
MAAVLRNDCKTVKSTAYGHNLAFHYRDRQSKECFVPEILNFSTLPAPVDSAPSAANLLSGDPKQQIWNVLSSGDGRFHVGQWASGVGAWRVHYTEYELCHLVEGMVLITSDEGGECRYRAGDTFVIPSGFRGTWEVIEPCKKIYAIYE